MENAKAPPITPRHGSGCADWRQQLAHAPNDAAGLARVLGVAELPDGLAAVVRRFPFQATSYFLALGDLSDPRDPIRIQAIPDPRELDAAPDESPDPFGEACRTPTPGLVQRFADRALIVATQRCAVRCRHCTRKHMLHQDRPEWTARDFDRMLSVIQQRPRIREVLVSGGDPFLLDTAVLDRLLGMLRAVQHVRVLRIGTRVPVTLPMRVDADLCAMLRRHAPVWVNTQFNHPVELTPLALQACGRLVDAGIPVSNQNVLLRGVNDRLETLETLFAELQQHRIRPYYAFHGDPVTGTAHLRTEVRSDLALAEGLRSRLGGLALPRFVADVAGSDSKVPLESLCAR